MADNYREVRRGTIEVQYWIIEYDAEGGSKQYDWRRSDGTEASYLYDTAEEAEEDAKYG